MAKLIVVLDLPGRTAEELKRDVRDADARECGEADAIATDNVTAADVLSLIYGGSIGYDVEEQIVNEFVEDGGAFSLDIKADAPDEEALTEDDECGAHFTTGGVDPYGTECDLPTGHYPMTKHEGPDPFGNDTRVKWNGGGSCAGDPLPYRDVEFGV